MASFFKNLTRKEDPTIYQNKDGHLKRTLRVRDFLALGVGTIVSTAIFTLPGVVAIEHAGPLCCIIILTCGDCCRFSCLLICRNGINNAFRRFGLFLD